jgi:hypothetical protein
LRCFPEPRGAVRSGGKQEQGCCPRPVKGILRGLLLAGLVS